jgi:2',3'-cyclic-nucleotide 2'-phosphodiesterase (5'-nucleotidase family)
VVTRTVPKATDMTELISKWNTLAAPIGNRPIGYISADIPNTGTESPMGDLIADAQFAYGKSLDPETDLALMNPGGVRAGLTYAAKGSEGDGVVTYAEGFTVQPFANTVNLQNFTGAQLIQVLKEQVSGPNAAAPKILQPSSGLTYTLDLTKTGAGHLPRRDQQLPRGRRRRLPDAGPGHGRPGRHRRPDGPGAVPDRQLLGHEPARAAGHRPDHGRAVGPEVIVR